MNSTRFQSRRRRKNMKRNGTCCWKWPHSRICGTGKDATRKWPENAVALSGFKRVQAQLKNAKTRQSPKINNKVMLQQKNALTMCWFECEWDRWWIIKDKADKAWRGHTFTHVTAFGFGECPARHLSGFFRYTYSSSYMPGYNEFSQCTVPWSPASLLIYVSDACTAPDSSPQLLSVTTRIDAISDIAVIRFPPSLCWSLPRSPLRQDFSGPISPEYVGTHFRTPLREAKLDKGGAQEEYTVWKAQRGVSSRYFVG
ncbi:hypothetical protein BDZ97DRAFT_1766172 [Flammula alnicola]|nr:hypothetical protein BDZ97DRAFT_1766172 [Flammula alnicola]